LKIHIYLVRAITALSAILMHCIHQRCKIIGEFQKKLPQLLLFWVIYREALRDPVQSGLSPLMTLGAGCVEGGVQYNYRGEEGGGEMEG
jgi:hypothetical protein